MITRNHLFKLLAQFQKICLEWYSNGIDIDLLNRDERDQRLGLPIGHDPAILLARRTSKPCEAICQLVRTPRLLKLVLRRTYRTWEKLHGEIDFHDLLVANILRFSAPEAFEFMLDHYREIRGLDPKYSKDDREQKIKVIEEKWSLLTTNVNWDIVSAKILIQFIFPAWHDKWTSHKVAPQGLQGTEPTDYWHRFLLEELEQNEAHDQELLHSIKSWSQNSNVQDKEEGKKLLNSLCANNDFAHKFEYFASFTLDGKEIRNIASKLFLESLNLLGVSANSDSIPGFIPLWRRAVRQPIDEVEHLDWIEVEVLKALPISLQFCNDIYYYWRSNSEMDIQHKEAGVANLRSNIKAKAKDTLKDNPSLLVKILDPSYMHSSYHFSILFDSKAEGGAGFVVTEWEWFSLLLLEACESAPQAVIPQIVCFVIDTNRSPRNFSYYFKIDFAKEFFGDNLYRAMNLLSIDIELENFNNDEMMRIKTAHDFAKEWVDNNGK